MKFLSSKGISSIIHYPIAVHQQQAFKKFAPFNALEKTEKAVKEVLSIPMSPQHSKEQIIEIADAINSFSK